MPERKSWAETLAALKEPPVLRMLFLGFSAGLPLLLIFSSLSVWLREAGIDRGAVTAFSWAALGYSFKFVWAPLIDRLPCPFLTRRLGRRRGWLLAAQLGVAFALVFTGSFDPAEPGALIFMAVGAVLIGFMAATQDIVIDAYRIESADVSLQSMMAGTYQIGYRVAMVVAGAGALYLADFWQTGESYDYSAWSRVYWAMAAIMALNVVTTLTIPEPAPQPREDTHFRTASDHLRFLVAFFLAVAGFIAGFVLLAGPVGALRAALAPYLGLPFAAFLAEAIRFGSSAVLAALLARFLIAVRLIGHGHMRETFIAPIADFLARYGNIAILILVFIGVYRISDIVMGAIANVFYVDMGFSKSQIATYSKFLGLIATLFGGLLGGAVALRFGVMWALFLGAAFSAATNLLFAMLAGLPPLEWVLGLVIAADNIAAGAAGSAFIAYLSSLTSIRFTAMQYALFTSVMTLLPKVLAGYSGQIVDAAGYEAFFIGTALLGVPVLLLIVWLRRLGRRLPRTAGAGNPA